MFDIFIPLSETLTLRKAESHWERRLMNNREIHSNSICHKLLDTEQSFSKILNMQRDAS
jgi:hypothetical protein